MKVKSRNICRVLRVFAALFIGLILPEAVILLGQESVTFAFLTDLHVNPGSSSDKLLKPCYVLPGNHETNWSESAGLTFNKFWGNDRFLFDYNGYLFVGFNTGHSLKLCDGHVKQAVLL